MGASIYWRAIRRGTPLDVGARQGQADYLQGVDRMSEKPSQIERDTDRETHGHEMYIELSIAARDLLQACDMDEHNEAIMHGKTGKAWSGEFVRKQRIDAMKRVRALMTDKYRCTKCGCLWRLNPPSLAQPEGSWSLYDADQFGKSCKTCDNSPEFVSVIEPVLS